IGNSVGRRGKRLRGYCGSGSIAAREKCICGGSHRPVDNPVDGRHHGRSMSLTRAILSSSNKMDPEISCSDDMRVSKWSRTFCAQQFRSGTMNENFMSCQLGDAPVTMGLSPMGLGASTHVTRQTRPRLPRMSPLYLALNS